MKIALGGKSGTGKSEIGRRLKALYNCEYMSGGNIFRQVGLDLGYTIEEFDKMLNATDDYKYDKMLDNKQKEFVNSNDKFILDSHLSWYNAPEAIKIKLYCDDDVRFSRTSKVDVNRIGTTIEDEKSTMIKTLEREKALKDRIMKIYGIEDLHADEHFDLVIDTTKLNIEEVFSKAIEFIENRK